MPKNRALPILICTLLCVVTILADDNLVRKKRQAPNINVHEIPKTSFSCIDRTVGEYYADPETECQVYHICVPGMHNKMTIMSFVCPNGTIFSQATRVCTPYERVYCRLTDQFYDSVGGVANSKPTVYENDNIDNYVPQPAPREPPQAPRQSSRGRNTQTAPPPPPPTQPPRGTRFRSGASQFRGQQGAPATTAAPTRPTTTAPPARLAPARPVAPARPAAPAFRPPAIPVRPGIAGVANAVPQRPTPRATVTTSTASYNYEYEYEYDYEDEAPAADQGNTRSKREAPAVDEYDLENFEENFEKSGFTCNDKVAGGVYADIESDCEMFHICVPLGKYKMLDYKVFCANGTAFDQETGSCKEKSEFNCESARLYYQYEKPNQPASSKKPVLKKKKPSKSKKVRSISKE